MRTARLELRPIAEADRGRFVEFFCDDEFMVFSGGVNDIDEANGRFDHMLDIATRWPFAKQPVVESASGQIVGYSGVGEYEFEGELRLEYGYRLIPDARGRGYATEACSRLLRFAFELTALEEVVAVTDPENHASQHVLQKSGLRDHGHRRAYAGTSRAFGVTRDEWVGDQRALR